MNRKVFALSLLTVGIVLVCCLFFFSSLSRDIFSGNAKPPKGIILISLDTLRADHLGTYGYYRNTSPNIDSFAAESIVFDWAVAQSAFTLPSHMSIMTSLYPSSHGVIQKYKRLADEEVTLAELLREGGYRTAAFADGALMQGDYGFKQGFDLYDGDEWIGIARILPKAKKWLEENKSHPFFLFIHCYDIHDPYSPPPPYDTIFHDFDYTGNFVPSTNNMQSAAWRRLKVTDADLRHIKALYDGGIRYTDEKIGEFLTYLEETGLKDDALIIITSDHGEEFKEHGSFLHWKLYFRPNLHVPLIMHIPDYPKQGIRVKEQVQSIDILPTVLGIAKLPPHPKAQGRSLLPVIKRNSSFAGRFWWEIAHRLGKEENISIAEQHETQKSISHKLSIISDGRQMIYNETTGAVQLFDLKKDPLAQNNLAEDHEGIARRLLAQLNSLYGTIPKYTASTFTLDETTRKQLEMLGYIDDGEDDMGDVRQPSQVEHHWLEAECADAIVKPLEKATDQTASGGEYMYAPNGAGNNYDAPGSIAATYTVKISGADTYVLWGRVQAPDARDNSFFVQLDDNEDYFWEVQTGEDWHWDAVNDPFGPDPVMFTLKPGGHTIKIKLREDGTKLDTMLLTNDLTFVPSGKGARAEKH